MDAEAQALIAGLGLEPHPEGGYYRETWRAGTVPGMRSAGTAILYLLAAGQRSHWHRVDADELWLWHAGSPIDLLTADSDSDSPSSIQLGGAVLAGGVPQSLVPAGQWQSAETREGWALVSCVVVPGFDFSGFEMAPPGWAPGA